MRRLISTTRLEVPKGTELDAKGVPVVPLQERRQKFWPAVAIFTDGTNLVYFAVPYMEPEKEESEP